MAQKRAGAKAVDKELADLISYDDELQRHLFHVFTIVGLTFLSVYGVLQAHAGYNGLAILYVVTAIIIALNRWAIRYHNKLSIATNIYVALGPMVILPWQVTGGVATTGLMWFAPFTMFAMFFVPGKGGSFWVIGTYCASFFLFLLQLQGTVPLPFPPEVMFHFYFVGGITYALTFLFLHAQRLVFRMLKLRLVNMKIQKEVTMVGEWSWNVGSNKLDWSEQLYEIFGLAPRKKMTYQVYLDLVHPHDRQLTEETVQEALKDYQPYSLIHRVRRPNGSIVWVHCLGEVVLGAQGKPTRVFGTTQDITKRMTNRSQLELFDA